MAEDPTRPRHSRHAPPTAGDVLRDAAAEAERGEGLQRRLARHAAGQRHVFNLSPKDAGFLYYALGELRSQRLQAAHDAAAAGTNGSRRRNPRDVCALYHALVTGELHAASGVSLHESAPYWSLLARGGLEAHRLDLEIPCSPETAVEAIQSLYGWETHEACRRWLSRQREKGVLPAETPIPSGEGV